MGRSKYWMAKEIAGYLDKAIAITERDCKARHRVCNYDTVLPFGRGVDLHLLPAMCSIERNFSDLSHLVSVCLNTKSTLRDLTNAKLAVIREAMKQEEM